MANEQALTIAALESAIQMEIDGKEYYANISRTCRNPVGQKLLAALSAEEDRHRQKFELIYKDVALKKSWPEVKIEAQAAGLQTVFSEASGEARFDGGEIEAVQKAMEMENKTRDFYLERAEKAVFSAEKDYYTRLAQEERVHHNLLQDYYEYMQNPAQYFTMKEKHSLDGG